MSIPFQVDFIANWCNHWPYVRIVFNDTVLVDRELAAETSIIVDLELEEQNTLKIQHYGKRQGENHIYDTVVDQQGNITQDCNFRITKLGFDRIWFNQLAAGRVLFQNTKGFDNVNIDSIVGIDGEFVLEIPRDYLSWLTLLKFKQEIAPMEEYSNYTLLFHYEKELEIIQEIKDLIK
jgi:hypothetical protein